ncbi:outer membrane beta-barrel protein, partial [Acinetobacter baumannii]
MSGTMRARFGFTPMDRFLVYLTGGVAYGQVIAATSLSSSLISYSGSDRDLRVGWAVGAGVEYALNSTLSARL